MKSSTFVVILLTAQTGLITQPFPTIVGRDNNVTSAIALEHSSLEDHNSVDRFIVRLFQITAEPFSVQKTHKIQVLSAFFHHESRRHRGKCIFECVQYCLCSAQCPRACTRNTQCCSDNCILF